jgi:hypothetical protein
MMQWQSRRLLLLLLLLLLLTQLQHEQQQMGRCMQWQIMQWLQTHSCRRCRATSQQ